MNRLEEGQLLDFCVQQKERFDATAWSSARATEQDRLALVAMLLASAPWYGHRDALLQLAQRLNPQAYWDTPALVRALDFDCSRFFHMLRWKLDNEQRGDENLKFPGLSYALLPQNAPVTRSKKWLLFAIAACAILLAAGLEPFGSGGAIHEIDPDAIQSGRSYGLKRGREDWLAKKPVPELDTLAAFAAENAAHIKWTASTAKPGRRNFSAATSLLTRGRSIETWIRMRASGPNHIHASSLHPSSNLRPELRKVMFDFAQIESPQNRCVGLSFQ